MECSLLTIEMAKAVTKAEEQNNNKAKFLVWSWYLLIAIHNFIIKDFEGAWDDDQLGAFLS